MQHFTHSQQKASIFYGVGEKWGSQYKKPGTPFAVQSHYGLGVGSALGATPTPTLGGGSSSVVVVALALPV